MTMWKLVSFSKMGTTGEETDVGVGVRLRSNVFSDTSSLRWPLYVKLALCYLRNSSDMSFLFITSQSLFKVSFFSLNSRVFNYISFSTYLQLIYFLSASFAIENMCLDWCLSELVFFFFFFLYHVIWGFLSGGKKNPPANAGDAVSIPGSERSPGEENDNLLQYSCLGIPMDRGAWRVTVHGIAKSWTWLSD